MNFDQVFFKKICISPQEQDQVKIVEYFDWKYDYHDAHSRLIKITFQIIQKINDEVIFVNNGQILRKDSIQNFIDEQDKTASLDRIIHLRWIGVEDQNKIKIGKWMVVWDGQILQSVGGQYSQNGKKQGLWKEPIKNFFIYSSNEFYEIGEYQENQRKGIWQLCDKMKMIGGGVYDNKGQKHGKWIELNENFYSPSAVTCYGEYKHGKKQGKWGFKYTTWPKYESNFQIYGGSYNENGQKQGKWVDLSENFNNWCQVIYSGEYQNGKKQGNWDIMHKFQNKMQYKLIGGGSYDLKNCKNGQWIELNDSFWDWSRVICIGQYKSGRKIGRWDYKYTDKIIGGGSYGENGLKNGKWQDLSDNFYNAKFVLYDGQYNYGVKIGQWNTYFKKESYERDLILIGGGLYDQEGLKTGEWIDLAENFSQNNELTYKGVYSKGTRQGEWEILRRYHILTEKVGGGSFNENGMKSGKWVDLIDDFNNLKQVILEGKYENGKKEGRWDILNRLETTFNLIGGGTYDVNGLKKGNWIELSEKFYCYFQITYNGQYNNGYKFGTWIEINIKDQKKLQSKLQKQR